MYWTSERCERHNRWKSFFFLKIVKCRVSTEQRQCTNFKLSGLVVIETGTWCDCYMNYRLTVSWMTRKFRSTVRQKNATQTQGHNLYNYRPALTNSLNCWAMWQVWQNVLQQTWCHKIRSKSQYIWCTLLIKEVIIDKVNNERNACPTKVTREALSMNISQLRKRGNKVGLAEYDNDNSGSG